jgi:hypothetical protein
MDIVFHIGAHATDEGLLIRSLLRNRDLLAGHGVGLPGPGRYRQLIGEVSTTLRGEAADAETEAMLLDTIRDDETATRIVLSNENFICRPQLALGTGRLYPRIEKAAWLGLLFPETRVSFALALRNPATFVPDMVRKGESSPVNAPRAGGMWSDVVERLFDACPDAEVIAWCHEDAPLIWSQIMREVAGVDAGVRLQGGFDMAKKIMTDAGRARLTEFSTRQAGMTERQRTRAVASFLAAHARDDAVTQEIDLPGWTEETVAWLSEDYEEDVAAVAEARGVTFLSP